MSTNRIEPNCKFSKGLSKHNGQLVFIKLYLVFITDNNLIFKKYHNYNFKPLSRVRQIKFMSPFVGGTDI